MSRWTLSDLLQDMKLPNIFFITKKYFLVKTSFSTEIYCASNVPYYDLTDNGYAVNSNKSLCVILFTRNIACVSCLQLLRDLKTDCQIKFRL